MLSFLIGSIAPLKLINININSNVLQADTSKEKTPYEHQCKSRNWKAQPIPIYSAKSHLPSEALVFLTNYHLATGNCTTYFYCSPFGHPERPEVVVLEYIQHMQCKCFYQAWVVLDNNQILVVTVRGLESFIVAAKNLLETAFSARSAISTTPDY